MPVGRRYDIQIGGKGYMLSRSKGGRAWSRTGVPDAPGTRSSEDAKYGAVADQLDHPEVWDDWSGGFGQAYRRGGENTYHWAENFDARFPRQLVHCQSLLIGSVASSVNVINTFCNLPLGFTVSGTLDIAEGNDGVVMAAGGGFARLQPTSNAVLQGWAVNSTVASAPKYYHRSVLFGSFIYLPSSSGSWFAQLDLKTNDSKVPSTSLRSRCFAVVGNAMWRAHGAAGRENLIQKVAIGGDPLTEADWSATYNLGNGMYGVNDMQEFNDQLFVGMPDGLYAGDSSGTFVNVLPQIANHPHLDNCRDIAIHDDSLVIQHVGGVIKYQSNGLFAQATEIGPNLTGRSPVRGFVRALRSYAGWLYGGIDTGSQSYIVAGRETGDGWRWHTMHRLPAAGKINRIHFDAITTASRGTQQISPRMWLSTDASINPGGTICWFYGPVPLTNGNPLGAPGPFSPSYVGSARIDLGAVDWNAPSTPKVYRAVDLWADNLASGAQWCDVYYSVDEGTRTKLGTIAKSPKDTLYFSSGEGSFVTGQQIALSIESFTASAAITPIYRSVVLRGALRPKSIDQIRANIRVADNIRDRQGQPIGRSGAAMLAELRTLANSPQPTQLIDLAGAACYVNMIAPVQEQEVYQTGMEEPEIQATVQMSVLTYS